MTVKDLKEFIDYYITHYSENDNVVLCDDGMKPEFFDVSFPFGTTISRKNENNYESEDVLVLRFDKFMPID